MLPSILAVLVAIVSIQIGASVAKELFPVLGAIGATSLRVFFAAIILSLVFRPWKISLTKKARKQIVLFGVSLGLMNVCFYKALEFAPQGIVVALEFTGPLALSFVLSRKPLDFLWVLLAGVGIALVFPYEKTEAAISILGIAFSLAAGFFWALYIFIGKKVGTEQGLGSIALVMCVASLVTFPMAFFDRGFVALWQPSVLHLVIAVALLSSVIPYTLELFALKKIPAKTFGILLSLEPAMAVLSGFVFLSQKITVLQGLAILLISAASLGSTLGSRTKKLPVQP